ncbi:Hemicentin-2 [Clonorchis sinensis]|uniref:Hemicentin-2 n=1 Tax=Clonorchis sinensis TaxID=79923 RepID=A0A419PZY7_CLOSI|nr:Hemicentin-2 [Clonorchis sinensis]
MGEDINVCTTESPKTGFSFRITYLYQYAMSDFNLANCFLDLFDETNEHLLTVTDLSLNTALAAIIENKVSDADHSQESLLITPTVHWVLPVGKLPGGTSRQSCTLVAAPEVHTNKVVYVRLGQSLRVECDVKSHPPADRVFWVHDKTLPDSTLLSQSRPFSPFDETQCLNESEAIRSSANYWFSSVLQINTVQHEDAGVYRCIAHNQIQTSSGFVSRHCAQSSTVVQVYYPPGMPHISGPNARLVYLGARIELECHLNQKSWSIIKFRILQQVALCTVSFSILYYIKYQRCMVRRHPVIKVCRTKLKPTHPKFDPGIPAADLRWMWRPRICQNLSEAREVVDGDERILTVKNRKRLVIRSAQLQHEGVYTCLASNGLGEAMSPFIDIAILGPVKITERPKILKTYDLASQPLSPIKLRCVARGRPQVSIHWLQNGRSVISENTLPRNNNAGQLQVFQVEGLNQIIVWQTRCIHFDDREFYWETHSELTFLQPVVREHEGIYTCQASSFNDTYVNATTELKLLYPPQLIYSQPLKFSIRGKHDYSFPSGEYVTDLLNDHAINGQAQSFQGVRESALPGSDAKQNLSCYLRSNPLPWRVFWERVIDSTPPFCSNKRPPVTENSVCTCMNGTPLAALDSTTVSPMVQNISVALLTGQAAAEHFASKTGSRLLDYTESLVVTFLSYTPPNTPELGLYAAHVENTQGCTTCYLRVQNYSVPEAPSSVQLINITEDRILLSWIPGYDGGYSQHLVVRLTNDQDPYSQSGGRTVIIPDIPSFPERQQCWFTGFRRGSTYYIVLYGENKLGAGPSSEVIKVKTMAGKLLRRVVIKSTYYQLPVFPCDASFAGCVGDSEASHCFVWQRNVCENHLYKKRIRNIFDGWLYHTCIDARATHSDLQFPKIVGHELNSDKIELQLQDDINLLISYCIQVEEIRTSSFISPSKIYDTCPKVPTTTASGELFAIEYCENGPSMTKNRATHRRNIMFGGSASSHPIQVTPEHRLIIALNASTANSDGTALIPVEGHQGAISNEESSGISTVLNYRLRFCYVKIPHECSDYISLNKDSSSTGSKFPILWICLNATVFPAVGLLIVCLWHARRRRQSASNEVWISRKSDPLINHRVQIRKCNKRQSGDPHKSEETQDNLRLKTSSFESSTEMGEQSLTAAKPFDLIQPTCSTTNSTCFLSTSHDSLTATPITIERIMLHDQISEPLTESKQSIGSADPIFLKNITFGTSNAIQPTSTSTVVLISAPPGSPINFADKSSNTTAVPLLFHIPVHVSTSSAFNQFETRPNFSVLDSTQQL